MSLEFVMEAAASNVTVDVDLRTPVKNQQCVDAPSIRRSSKRPLFDNNTNGKRFELGNLKIAEQCMKERKHARLLRVMHNKWLYVQRDTYHFQIVERQIEAESDRVQVLYRFKGSEFTPLELRYG